MKHLKYLPFLIGAAAYVPRVHAAETIAAAQSSEPSTLSLVLIAIGLVVLAAGRSNTTVIKVKE